MSNINGLDMSAYLQGTLAILNAKREMKHQAEMLEPGGYMERIGEGIKYQVDLLYSDVDLGDSEDMKLMKGLSVLQSRRDMLSQHTRMKL